ncbi:MAG: 2'-5' RNA ligase family protein [Oscillochloris sp.]|nr:2'-5' RNA ligase family protein [Oscillochloris sp.]
MHRVIMLTFDDVTEGAIRGLWADLAATLGRTDIGMAEIRPHVTLLSSRQMSAEVSAEIRQAVAMHTAPIELYFESVSAFLSPEGVVFLSPVVTTELLALQRATAAAAAGLGVEIEDYYRPGSWVPHCTLAWPLSSADIGRATARCHAVFSPLRGHAVAVAGIAVQPASLLDEGRIALEQRS